MASNILFQIVLPFLSLLAMQQAFVVQSIRFSEKSHSHESQKLQPHQVRRYLQTFGYLNDVDDINSLKNSGSGHDENLESALRIFQERYHLNVTGKIDAGTLALMKRPRCGVPDDVAKWANRTIGLDYAHFAGDLKWPPEKYNLKCGFTAGAASNVDSATLLDKVQEAMRTWSAVSQFTFELPQAGPFDVEISFQRGPHGDQNPFDGRGGVLAHSFAPVGGKMHIDADENWGIIPAPDQVDLVSVLIHEMGHILGLAHSAVPESIMYAYFDYGVTKRVLTADDVDGLKTLYPQP